MSYQSLGYANDYSSVPQQRIFTQNGNPLTFFIPYDELRRGDYIKLITENGGEISEAPEGNGVSQRTPIWLTSTYIDNYDTYKLEYVTESLKQGLQLDINGYKWTEFEHRHRQHQHQQHQHQQQQHQQQQHQQQQHQQQQQQYQQQYQQYLAHQIQSAVNNIGGISGNGVPVGGIPVGGLPLMPPQFHMPQLQSMPGYIEKRGNNSKHSFTPEEDELIIERVRRDPRRRTSHKLFDEIAKELTNHTGNSIRYRYRNQLESKLGYVYRTNPKTGGLVTDLNGNFIRESIDNLPKTMKTRFTAEDDKALCEKIVEYNIQEHAKQVDEGVTSGMFDINGPLTVPVSFFREMERQYPSHTRAAWRDRYRKFATKYGIKKYIDYCNSTDKPQPMKDFTKRGQYNLEDAGLLIRKQPRKDNNEDDEGSGALDEEIGQVKSSNIDDALLRTVKNEKKENNSGPTNGTSNRKEDDDSENELFVDAKEVETLQNTANKANNEERSTLVELLSQPQNTEETQEVAFTYPNSKMTLDHLFGPQFFNIKKDNIIKILGEIIEVGDSNTGNLFYQFESKLGFTELFSTIIILYTGGDYQKIWEYVNAVINNIYDETLSIEENETYKILEIEGINGVWSKKYDDMITAGRKEDIEELKKIHLIELIEARMEFLGQARKEDQVV